MHNSATHILTFATAAALGLLTALAQPASAQEAGSQAVYRDIEQTLGSVPSFFKQLPDTAIAGAWAEMKAFQLNPRTQLNGKTKELIGLAVAAQIPCQYCTYFHTAAAKANATGAFSAAIKSKVRQAIESSGLIWVKWPPVRSAAAFMKLRPQRLPTATPT